MTEDPGKDGRISYIEGRIMMGIPEAQASREWSEILKNADKPRGSGVTFGEGWEDHDLSRPILKSSGDEEDDSHTLK